jgi:serine/threonine-protein kinase
MADTSSERLIDSVIRSKLLADETIQLGPMRDQFHEPEALARELVRRDWITPFQAEKLLDDKAQELELGPYVLLELLGEGGMGRVYKARHRLMNRVVALKVIRSDLLASSEARHRFQREIEAAARVWHPNLVAALDAAPIGESFVLVMEYVEGLTLAKLLSTEGIPPIRHACDWVRQAALGLGHAHDQGLIHRDVKPSNLMLTTKGRVVKVTDLGLARLEALGDRLTASAGTEEPITASGILIGTPDYLAPEQALSPRDADPRSDLYSLGCTLFHLLTGRPPFPGGTLTQKLLWHQNEAPPDPARLRSSLPAGLSQVVLKMIAKRPDQRYADAAAVVAALELFCSATSLKTLRATESHASEPMIEPTRSTPAPMVHHQPQETTAYDLAEVDDVSTEADDDPSTDVAPEPEPPPPLSKPAVPGDDSWWQDEIRAETPSRAADLDVPTPTPAPPLTAKPAESPRPVTRPASHPAPANASASAPTIDPKTTAKPSTDVSAEMPRTAGSIPARTVVGVVLVVSIGILLAGVIMYMAR